MLGEDRLLPGQFQRRVRPRHGRHRRRRAPLAEAGPQVPRRRPARSHRRARCSSRGPSRTSRTGSSSRRAGGAGSTRGSGPCSRSRGHQRRRRRPSTTTTSSSSKGRPSASERVRAELLRLGRRLQDHPGQAAGGRAGADGRLRAAHRLPALPAQLREPPGEPGPDPLVAGPRQATSSISGSPLCASTSPRPRSTCGWSTSHRFARFLTMNVGTDLLERHRDGQPPRADEAARWPPVEPAVLDAPRAGPVVRRPVLPAGRLRRVRGGPLAARADRPGVRVDYALDTTRSTLARGSARATTSERLPEDHGRRAAWASTTRRPSSRRAIEPFGNAGHPVEPRHPLRPRGGAGDPAADRA